MTSDAVDAAAPSEQARGSGDGWLYRPEINSNDRILTLPEIAQVLRRPIATVRWWRKKNLGPRTWRAGDKVVAWESDVLAWLARQESATRKGGGQ